MLTRTSGFRMDVDVLPGTKITCSVALYREGTTVIKGVTYKPDGAETTVMLPSVSETGIDLAQVMPVNGEYTVSLAAKIDEFVSLTRKTEGDPKTGVLVGRLDVPQDATNSAKRKTSGWWEVAVEGPPLLEFDIWAKFELLTPEKEGDVGKDVRMNPQIVTLPDAGYNNIGMLEVGRGDWNHELQLYWYANGEPASPVSLRNFEDSNIRIIIPALSVWKWLYNKNDASSWTGVEFGYSESAHAWTPMHPDGTAAWVRGVHLGYGKVPLAGTSPVIVFSKRRPTRFGMIVSRVVMTTCLRERLTF